MMTTYSAGASVRTLTLEESERWAGVTKYREVQAARAQDQESMGVKGVGAAPAKVTSIMGEVMR